jgi:hypothetical protein
MVTELPKFGAMGLEMPYQGDKMSMVFILPNEGVLPLFTFIIVRQMPLFEIIWLKGSIG